MHFVKENRLTYNISSRVQAMSADTNIIFLVKWDSQKLPISY